METVMTRPVVITDMKKKASDILLAISWRSSLIIIFTSHHRGSTTRWTASMAMVEKEALRLKKQSSSVARLWI